jgi:stage II sporulation protein D
VIRHYLLLSLAACVAIPAEAAAPTPASITIRVALAERAPAAELRGFQMEIVELGPCQGCVSDLSRAEVVRTQVWRADAVRAVPNGVGLDLDGRRAQGFRIVGDRIRWNGRDYGGLIELIRNGDGVTIVNEVPLEDYVAGVLRAEAGERWPTEALRAQAIAARTYGAYHRNLGAGKPYHLVASIAHQQYAGRVGLGSPIWAAASETAGQVLLWEGELFPAFYHTESGGFTEDPRTVFAARNMPALKAVRCEFSTGSPHFYWTLDLKLSDLTETLRRHEVPVGKVTALEVVERTPSLRATWVVVQGNRGRVRLRGNDLRRMVGYDVLKSTLFAVAVHGDTAQFAGRGYGHGVGLCQWGAKGMAEQGYAARQILEFYYPGTTLGVLAGR